MRFELSEREVERVREWIDHHSKTHKLSSVGAIGGRWTYRITPTSIGDLISIECFCGAEADVSDMGNPQDGFPNWHFPSGECDGKPCGTWLDPDKNCEVCGKSHKRE